MHLMLRRNLGRIDQAIRIIAGLLLIFLAAFQVFTSSYIINILLVILGIAMLIEGWLAY